MASSMGALLIIFTFIGVFALLAVVVAGLATQDDGNTTNLSDTQDTQAIDKARTEELQGRVIWGLSKVQIVLIIIGILAVIGIFLKVLMGRSKRNY